MLYFYACCAVSPAFFELGMFVGIAGSILDCGSIGFGDYIQLYGFVGILLISINVIMCCAAICDLLSLFLSNLAISH